MILIWLLACEPYAKDPPSIQDDPVLRKIAQDERPIDMAEMGAMAAEVRDRREKQAATALASGTEVESGERIAARHILVAHIDAASAAKSLRRNRTEALAKAEGLLARLRAGEDFAAIASVESDDSSKGNGGYLGSFGRGKMVEPFEKAAFALQSGEISGIVESPFGFHIILRVELAEAELQQVMVRFAGASMAPAEVTRSRDEARSIAEEALARIQSGEAFGSVARELSDGQTAVRDGKLGRIEKADMSTDFADVVFALEPGAMTGLVESPFGFHIIKRLE